MRNVLRLLSEKQNSVGSAAMVLISMVFTSRILGLVRDRLLASRFTPDALGVYLAAFRLPNLLFELLVMGALTSAFIPVFTKYVTQKNEGEASRMASSVINLSFLILLVIAIPIFIFATSISKFLAPGFNTAQIDQMAEFTRFMIVFQVFPLLIGNFFTGILQSYNLFLIPALAPVVYNVGIIIGIVLLTPFLALSAPVVGVGIGAFFFMIIQVPLLFKVKYRHFWQVNIHDAGVQEVGKLMGPRTFGLAISQIDSTIDLILSSLLGARMVTVFTFAQQLQQLPIGLFGVTVAQAALPTLSTFSVKEDTKLFKETVISSVNQILFFVLPISVLFIVLRIPVVRLVFGATRFDWGATVLTGVTLSMFSLSLSAQAIVQVLARGFYALYDSKTPVIIGILSIATNSILSIVFVQFMKLPVWSLGLSTSIASLFNMSALLFLLDRRIHKFPRAELLVPPLKMFVASVITGFALFFPLKLFDQLVFDTTRTFGLILLTGVSGTAGLLTYLFLTWVMGVGEVHSFIALISKIRKPRAILLEPAGEVVNGGVENKLS